MYLYGIKSNNIYKITSKPFVISISGDAFSSINKFANLTHKLFGVNNLDLIIIKNFLNKSKENLLGSDYKWNEKGMKLKKLI